MDDNIIPPNPKGKTLAEFKIKEKSEFAKSVIDDEDLINLSNHGILRNKMKVPELRGLSLRKAIFTLNKSKLKFNVDGSGKVIWQSPKPGSLVSKGSTISMGLN